MYSPIAGGETTGVVQQRIRTAPPDLCFLFSATFHYLGPSFAVLLFMRVEVLGVAWLRIASAAVILLGLRRPWRAVRRVARGDRLLLLAWGTTLAVMNTCFYTAPRSEVRHWDSRLRWPTRSCSAHTSCSLIASPSAPASAASTAWRSRWGIAVVVVTPIGGWEALPAFAAPVALLAGTGVGISSSVVPYVTDQLAVAQLPRATCATMVALLPAIATVIGVVVLAQIPSPVEGAGLALVIGGVALHRP